MDSFEMNSSFAQELKKSAGVREALLAVGSSVEAAAERLAPVETGELKGSIKTVAEPTKNGQRVRVYATARHAAAVEKADVFLRQALLEVS